MRIEQYGKYNGGSFVRLPKMHKVIKVDLDVLRPSLAGGLGVIFDCDDVVERKVRRVKCENGWKWQLVKDSKDQDEWDYYFDDDKEIIEDINYELGLTK